MIMVAAKPRTFTSISPDSIVLGSIPFNLYASAAGGRLVLFCRAGLEITERHKEMLARMARQLYISSAEIEPYLGYASEQTVKQLASSSLSPAKKANIVTGVGSVIMQALLKDPRSGEIDSHSERYVDLMVELVLNSPSARDHLFVLSFTKNYLLAHSVNVCTFCILIAQNLYHGNKEVLWELGLGGLLHDIGMTQIDPEVYGKSRLLNDDEKEVVRKHPLHSYELLAEKGLSDGVLEMARSHHERADGSGYPYGIKGNEIHPFARIIAVIDVYDSLTSDRPHRQRFKPMQALKEMWDFRKCFEPIVLKELSRLVLRGSKLLERFEKNMRLPPGALRASSSWQPKWSLDDLCPF